MKKEQLIEILDEEKKLYLENKSYKKSYHKRYVIWQYLYYFRLAQFYNNERKKENNPIKRKIYKYYFRYYNKKRNIWSCKSGVEIGLQAKIGRNCSIWHSGVVIGGKVGNNCTFSGNNVVGTKDKALPVLNDNIIMGFGSAVVGDIEIASGCLIGTNAVVLKSVKEENAVLVGAPAKVIKYHE